MVGSRCDDQRKAASMPNGRLGNVAQTPVSLFRDPPDGGHPSVPGNGSQALESAEQETETREKKRVVCRQCLAEITDPDHRIEIEGAHMHTFANPHGIVFEIGCFDSADGCANAGPRTDDFTWFKGFQWQVAVCAGCMSHLGWLFVSGGGGAFYGLILDRLIFPEE